MAVYSNLALWHDQAFIDQIHNVSKLLFRMLTLESLLRYYLFNWTVGPMFERQRMMIDSWTTTTNYFFAPQLMTTDWMNLYLWPKIRCYLYCDDSYFVDRWSDKHSSTDLLILWILSYSAAVMIKLCSNKKQSTWHKKKMLCFVYLLLPMSWK
jgi:hypothetical protein